MKTKTTDPRFHTRHLPHIQPEDGVFFVTTRLAGSLPIDIVERLKEEYGFQKLELKNRELSDIEMKMEQKRCFEAYFKSGF